MTRAWIATERSGSVQHLLFECPGCAFAHGVRIRRDASTPHPAWDWNGDLERPTLSPSVLARTPLADGTTWTCHSFVKDGRIRFLEDSSHALANQTVDLPEHSDLRPPEQE